jgi:hypothetical protein
MLYLKNLSEIKMKTTKIYKKIRNKNKALKEKILNLEKKYGQSIEQINRMSVVHKKELDNLESFYNSKIINIIAREAKAHEVIENELQNKIKELTEDNQNIKKLEKKLKTDGKALSERDTNFASAVTQILSKLRTAVNLYQQGNQYTLVIEKELNNFEKKWVQI